MESCKRCLIKQHKICTRRHGKNRASERNKQGVSAEAISLKIEQRKEMVILSSVLSQISLIRKSIDVKRFLNVCSRRNKSVLISVGLLHLLSEMLEVKVTFSIGGCVAVSLGNTLIPNLFLKIHWSTVVSGL